jgi:hypothetical protein
VGPGPATSGKTPIFLQKTRAEPDYSEGRKRTQGQMRKKGRKNAIFLGHVQNVLISCGEMQFRDGIGRESVCYPA